MNNSKIRLKFKESYLKQEDQAPFTENNLVNLIIVYELDRSSRDLNSDFTLKDCLLGAVKPNKNAVPDKCKYSGCDLEFDSNSQFSISDGSMGKKCHDFGVDMRSSVHIDNKRKDIWILGDGATQGLDHTTLTAEAKNSINFSRSQRKFCLSLSYNGSNTFFIVNATKIYQFKANNSEMKKISLEFRRYFQGFHIYWHEKNRVKWIRLRIFCWL